MKTTSTVTAALAALLLASVSTSALAQPDDQHQRGARGQDGSEPGSEQRPMRGPRQDDMRQGAPAAPPAAAPAPPAAVAQAPPARNDRTDGRRDGNDGARRFGPGGQGANIDRGSRPDDRRLPAPAANGDRHDWNQVRGDHGDRFDNRDDNRDWDRRRGERPPTWQRGRYPPVYQSHQRFRMGGYRAPSGFYSRAWGFGEILPRALYGDNYRIGDFWTYDLPYPPPGYAWVRVGSDALLIDAYTGRIVQVVRYLFR